MGAWKGGRGENPAMPARFPTRVLLGETGPPHSSLGHRKGGRRCTQITGSPAIWCKMLPLKSDTLKSNLAKSLHHCF